MRALVTNDDGVDSAGIRTLAAVAVELGLDVLVAAPSTDLSGTSASLSAVEDDGRFLFEERSFDGSDVPVFAVEAAPAFIARAGLHGAFGPPPDIVLSGINTGPNTGHSVLHSGTVGAVLTASTLGVRGVALSIGFGETKHWDTAARVARTVIQWLLDTTNVVALNVNVPNLAHHELRGLRRAELASVGAVQSSVTEVGEGYAKITYADVDSELEPGTGAALRADGYASFTPLLAVCAATGVDTSNLA
ncbi:5'/3'-nucleotidase SurE [soil metagenome]